MSASSTHPALPGRPRAIFNVIANWTTFLISAVVGFLLTPFIVRTLGPEAYGAWVLLASLVGYLGILDLGVQGAVTRYVAAHHSAARHDEAGHLVSAALVLFGFSGAVAILLTATFATFGLDYLDLPPDLQDVARSILMIAGLNLAVSLVSGVFGGTVVGVQRFEVVNSVYVASSIARALAIVVCLSAGGRLLTLALIQLAGSVATGLALAWFSRRVYPELRIGLRRWRRRHLRIIVSFGSVATLLQVASLIMSHTDTLMIGLLLSVAEVTFFAIALSLIDYARQVVSGVSHTITPMVGALQAADRSDDVHNALLTGARVATLMLLPILLTFMIRGSTFIGLWMGPEYAESSGLVLLILAVSRWPAAGYQICTSTLLGLNLHRGLVPAALLETLVNVGLSLLLIEPFGITGVAIGTLVPRLLISLVFGPWYVRRTIQLSATRYFAEVLIRPGIALVPFAIASYVFETASPPDNLWIFFLQVAVTLPLALAGAWPVALQADERRQALELLRNTLSGWLRR
jgi:O-antigen/teichoic acid export membrane protein